MSLKDFMNTVKNEAGEAVEITKLKTKISKEKANIKSNYEKIGEIVFKRYADTECDDAQLAEFVAGIKASKEMITNYTAEIDRVKMND